VNLLLERYGLDYGSCQQEWRSSSWAEACVTEAGGTWMAAARKRPEDDVALREGSLSEKEFAPIPALSRTHRDNIVI
jgi:hypothetical protein